MKGMKSWTPNEDRRLLELKEEGFTSKQAGIFLHRSTSSIEQRLACLREGDKKREARLARVRAYKKAKREEKHQKKEAATIYHYVANPIAVPDHVIAERNARLSRLPESISELLLGDPHPLRSALAQKVLA